MNLPPKTQWVVQSKWLEEDWSDDGPPTSEESAREALRRVGEFVQGKYRLVRRTTQDEVVE